MGRATHAGKITRRKMVKHLMANGIRRNQARLICLLANQSPEIKTKMAWKSLVFHPDFVKLEVGGWLWDGE